MATAQMNGAIPHLRRVALLQNGAGLTDGQLLECFLTRREEAAFEALVRRHGAMVLGVCRRVLQNAHDAEDAFQATFLVLARKATTLQLRAAVGNWLYGVAYHTALKARAATLRRRAKEAEVRSMPWREARTEPIERDWQPLLDHELSRLPDKYREPVVLCDLEGKTRKEAARQLGIPEGTLSGRLTTARRRLAKRLARQGWALSAGALTVALSQSAASACVPMPLALSTAKAATILAAGGTAAGIISAKVAALTEGVMKAMLITKLKMTGVFLLVVGLIAVSSGSLAHYSLADTAEDLPVAASTFSLEDQEPADEIAQRRQAQATEGTNVAGTLQAVDADKNIVTIGIFTRRDGQSTKTYSVATDAKVLRDGKAIKLADLKQGSRVALTLSPDQKTAVTVTAAGRATQTTLTAVDAEKGTITITVENRQGKQAKTHPVAKDAKITLDGKEAKLADLKAGAVVILTFSAEDGNTILQVQTPRRRGSGEE
jgi:RNA polymerase sigma factor (sigma-70 family)